MSVIEVFYVFLTIALAMTVITNRLNEALKPAALAFEAQLVKWNVSAEIANRILKTLYILIEAAGGFAVAAAAQINPFATAMPDSPVWFAAIPPWVSYALFAGLVSTGSETLHTILALVTELKNWLADFNSIKREQIAIINKIQATEEPQAPEGSVG